MKNVTLTPMNLVTMILTGILCLGLSGCESGNTTSAEVVSPTGCNKSQGRYFDPLTKTCVKAQNPYQARVLNAYRYVNQLAEENKLKEAEYNIQFKTYLTPQKAEAFWSELHSKGATMSILSGAMPNNRQYDPESGQVADGLKKYVGSPKAWGGELDYQQGCGWMERDDGPSDQTIQGMIFLGLKSMENERPRPELRKAIVEAKDCRLYSFYVTANPKVIQEWWNKHLNHVEGIQPMVNTIDKAQNAFGHIQMLKEGN